MSFLFAERALVSGGWASDVLIEIEDGHIVTVAKGADRGDAEAVRGPVIAGMANVHSHAFQRAMAGLAEAAGPTRSDTFWTWRETMYDLLGRIGPEQLHAVAAQLYAELLCGGFTSVAEFHYLHNAPGGARYDDPAETSVQLIEAARRTGMAILLLPVLYERGGFDGRPLQGPQRRALSDPEWILEITSDLFGRYFENGEAVRIGVAAHSLRAVGPEGIKAIDTGRGPVHIHVAEQLSEVEECEAALGARPVEWLTENVDLGPSWCLVHATHLDDTEIRRLAASQAVVGLCPTTEANLGDGVFPLAEFIAAGGKFGIGTDSHVERRVAYELRMLEYGQRLSHLRRNIGVSGSRDSVGASLFLESLDGGARVAQWPFGAIAAGRRADVVVLDGENPDLERLEGDALLDAFVFSGHDMVLDVMAGGEWVVRDGRHVRANDIERDYRHALRFLRA